MYLSDSGAGLVEAFDFDGPSGEISGRRTLVHIDQPGMAPDGLTVDAEGCVWAAKWGGGRVLRYAPDGTLLLDLRFPASRMTSCMFVGPRLDTLAVTSARHPGQDEPLAGAVFLIDPGTTGIAEVPAAADLLRDLPAQSP
jgi:sugar lactone lactonase YvrE